MPQGRTQESRVGQAKHSLVGFLPHTLTHLHRLILTYLIPCHLLNAHTLPTETLLKPHPRLQKLFLPLCEAIKKGDLHKFDLALQDGEDEFVKRRIYLTLERGRDLALRNLVRKVFLAGGFEEPKEPDGERMRRTRVPIAEFAAAITLSSGQQVDNDEVECYLANMIYKVSELIRLSFVPTNSTWDLCQSISDSGYIQIHRADELYLGFMPVYE